MNSNSTSNQNDSSKSTMSVFSLIMITSALFLTLRNVPMMVEVGMQMIFFNVIAAFAFLIPAALVSAELATGWPRSGVYYWVSAAISPKFGFVAVWLQWAQSMFGMTSILAYIAATMAYLINPEFAKNKYFIFGVIIVVYWSVSMLNLLGPKLSGIISKVCVILGVFLPIIALIVLGIIYAMQGNTIHLDYNLNTQSLFPSIGESKNLIMLLSFVFGFVGIEVSASHAREIKNVRRNYPLAIFVSAILGFSLTLAAGFSLSFILPIKNMDLVAGAVQGFTVLSKVFHIPWLIPLSASLVAFGAIGQISTWVLGPLKGLHEASEEGMLPKFFTKVNGRGAPRNLIIVQAIVLSFVGTFILILKSVDIAFLILTSIAILLYSIMYILMFISVIKLRYTQPNTKRPYKIPGGKIGVWIVAGVGFITVLACFFIGFIPSGMPVIDYELIMILSVGLIVLIPIIIFKKNSINRR
ncbi:MAG: APC family permease [Bacteroidota bacterium]